MRLTSSIPVLLCITTLATANAGAQGKTSYQFAFGDGKIESGWTRVFPTNVYSDAIGYGFEPGADVAAADGCIASTNPFYFSVKLPEGNYRVTVDAG